MDTFQTSISDVIEFLTELFHQGYSYETINTARSALSSLCVLQDNFTVGSHPLVIKFMTGVFNLRPTKPKYTETWDVSKVLCYLKQFSPVKDVSLKMLTFKLVMLVALTRASRSSSISLLTLENFKKDEDSFTMYYSGLLKQSKKGRLNPVVKFNMYTPDRRICVYGALEEYIHRTNSLRGNEKRLFISYVKPYKAVTSSTISRWLKNVMSHAGIDTTKFKSHSIRSASVSKAKLTDVPIQEIMQVAGWSSDKTFAEYYDKPVQLDTFDKAVLQ